MLEGERQLHIFDTGNYVQAARLPPPTEKEDETEDKDDLLIPESLGTIGATAVAPEIRVVNQS